MLAFENIRPTYVFYLNNAHAHAHRLCVKIIYSPICSGNDMQAFAKDLWLKVKVLDKVSRREEKQSVACFVATCVIIRCG